MPKSFKVAEGLVHPQQNSIEFPDGRLHLEPKAMDLLVYLAERPDQVISKQRLIQAVWPQAFVTDEVLTNAIWKLRQVFHDDPLDPKVIQTVSRRGYQLIAPVTRGETGAGSSIYRRWAIAATTLALAAAVFLTNVGGLRDRLLGKQVPREITAIAVLPLGNLMNDPEQDYFVAGMHEALITELSRISALRVIGRTSALRFKETELPLTEIASLLNVDALVQGSVLRSEGRVRITARLIGLEPERHLWAESYDRQLGDVLKLHSEVAREVAGQIQVALSPQEEQRLSEARTVDPKAYDAYLKGRHHLSRRTPRDLERGLEYFRQAVGIDPDYALAYVGAADAYSMLEYYGEVDPSDFRQRSKTALGKALALDSTLGEAHASLAGLRAIAGIYVGLDGIRSGTTPASRSSCAE